MPDFDDVVNIYLLTDCDMGCKFCYASKDLGMISQAQARRTIGALAARGAKRVNLTGGEILMHPEAIEIVRLTREAGLEITMFTSGSLYTEDIAREFSPYISWLALSLDGDREVNRKMGRSARHFDGALDSIRITRRVAPEVKIRVATVATSVNLQNLPAVAELLSANELRPDLWRIKQMVPTRRAREYFDELRTEVDDFVCVTDAVKRQYSPPLRIDAVPMNAKEGDTMCVHPDGAATATFGDGAEMAIHTLGNMFTDPEGAIDNWLLTRHKSNAANYANQWRHLPVVKDDHA